MRITTALILSFAALPAVAGNIYKWTDARGQVHYSQTPPSGVDASLQSQSHVLPAANPPVPPAATAAVPAAAAPASVAKPAAAPPETRQAKAERCAGASERLAFLEESTPRRLVVQQPDGSEARMTEEEFAERVAKAKEAGKGC